MKHHRYLTPTLFLREPLRHFCLSADLVGGFELPGPHYICHISFYKDRKAPSSQGGSRGFADFYFFFKGWSNAVWSRWKHRQFHVWWRWVWKDWWNELFCRVFRSMTELDLYYGRNLTNWNPKKINKDSWAPGTLAVTCIREFGCTVGEITHTFVCVSSHHRINCLMLTKGSREALVHVGLMLHSWD